MTTLLKAARQALEVLKYVDYVPRKDGSHPVENVITELSAAINEAETSEREPKTCVWTLEDEENMPETYRSSCGQVWTFVGVGLVDNVNLCYGCGKPIETKEQS